MTFGWGESERVGIGSGFYTYAFATIFFYFFLASPFCVCQWLAVCLVCEAVSCFLKDENVAIYFYIHTIQLTLLVSKIAPFFFLCFA